MQPEIFYTFQKFVGKRILKIAIFIIVRKIVSFIQVSIEKVIGSGFDLGFSFQKP